VLIYSLRAVDTLKPLFWREEAFYLLDQRILPEREDYLRFERAADVAQAIRDMVVRGAPAIGITAAYGVALAARETQSQNSDEFVKKMQAPLQDLRQTRPTAVNLFWALSRMNDLMLKTGQKSPFDLEKTRRILLEEAHKIHEEDIAANRKMGALGQQFIPQLERGAKVLTHCNAGALATGGFGTALGVIYAAKEAGKKVMVFADETRPFLQGARLTAWELAKNNVPVTLICDNMAGHIMKTQGIDLVVVGADRIAANGDVANKIGTYSLAILAREHNVPFYVAAPLSTLDFTLQTGADIPIEERNSSEITDFGNRIIAPLGITVQNPAFDITPHSLIQAIITEKGIAKAPFQKSLEALR
jgi:methylthioribose-1-phosphate isomerase